MPGIGLYTILTCTLALSCCSPPAKEANTDLNSAQKISTDSIEVDIDVYCFWWKESEMDFEIDKIPPKSTYIKIEKWEYSDPVLVPHPDSVDIHIKLTNHSSNGDSLVVRMKSFIATKRFDKKELEDVSFPVAVPEAKYFIHPHDSLTIVINNIPFGKRINSLIVQDNEPTSWNVVVQILNTREEDLKIKEMQLPVIVGD